ncbi:MAG: polysaccharide biosynthesis tyrosine autokinase [Bacteroides sp]|nr:polysaccharide biosynthesis tyrosine autokinase [Bacteroides sp.]
MTTTQTNKVLKNPQSEGINLYGILLKYWVYWPWFVASIAICLTSTYIYLRYQQPVYNIKAAVLIKEQDAPKNNNHSALSAIQDLGMISMTKNFDNELQILKSMTIVKKVVSDLELYITHAEDRRWGYDLPLYQNVPVKVYMSPNEADKLENIITLEMDYRKEGILDIKMKYIHDGQKKELEQSFKKLPVAFPSEVGVITFTPDSAFKKSMRLKAHIYNPNGAAAQYGSNMSVTATSKTTTIAQINVYNTVKQRGIDFINHLVDVYNQEANDEKNEVAQKTAEFIEERIGIINKELGNTENTLATFKQRSRLTDLNNDAQMALQETSRYEQQLTANETELNLIQELSNYIHNPENADEVIPANVGIQDPNLAHVINQYNTMMVERKRLLRTSSENNPAVINLNSGIEAMRNTVQATVKSVLRGLQITEANLKREARKHEGRISNAPNQEKEYMSIARQQEIKANLYTILLQKREDNAITLASTASNGRIIEQPMAAGTPVSPKKKVYLLGAFIIGVALPIGFIYLMDLLKYRIEKRSDVERITHVPIIGEIPKGDLQKNVRGSILIHENKNDMMEEVFRSLRTNLLFMLTPEQKVVMITSTQPGEGKSFISGNLAVSLAYLGKKVIIIGLDIRKSGMEHTFDIDKHRLGITDYLGDPTKYPLSELIIPSEISPNLDILPRGSVPPNPTELVDRPALEEIMKELKNHYDLILLDTAPAAMVTDTSIISRVADICIYICRADYTPKMAFQFINEWQQSTHLRVVTVINSIDYSMRKNSVHLKYGYGYGYKYG